MKRIVICYDGTWNAVTDPDAVTNVVRMGQAVRPTSGKDGASQVVYYNAGVGSGGPLDRILGGVFGVGLRSNVKRGLAFLSLNWDPGHESGSADEIYIFGFSRGAYSARALAGVIGAIGGIPKQVNFDQLEKIWEFYRTPPKKQNRKEMLRYIHGEHQNSEVHGSSKGKPVIKCLGVWDTVGSYGIPAGFGLGALARYVTAWTRGFHSNTLGQHVEIGLHAMAIDERRRTFPPTVWLSETGRSRAGQTVEQVWFAGTHSNVGGGYKQSGLSDLALVWMIARVSELTKLDFDDHYIAENFWPCAACSLYRPEQSWPVSRFWPYVRGFARKEEGNMKRINEMLHWSVAERRGRLAIVDGVNYGEYKLDFPKAFEPVVTQRTAREDELIDMCRKQQMNPRITDCALRCDISEQDRHRGRKEMLRQQWE